VNDISLFQIVSHISMFSIRVLNRIDESFRIRNRGITSSTKVCLDSLWECSLCRAIDVIVTRSFSLELNGARWFAARLLVQIEHAYDFHTYFSV